MSISSLCPTTFLTLTGSAFTRPHHPLQDSATTRTSFFSSQPACVSWLKYIFKNHSCATSCAPWKSGFGVMPGRGGVSLQQRTLMDFNITDYCSAKRFMIYCYWVIFQENTGQSRCISYKNEWRNNLELFDTWENFFIISHMFFNL